MADNIPIKDSTGATKTLARKEFASIHYDQFAGLSNARIASAASTNITAVKTSPGSIASVSVYNGNAAVRYLKLYNKATAPVLASDVPVVTLPIAPSGNLTIEPPGGINFSLGIHYAITSGVADTDTGAVSANDVHGLITYI